MYQAAPVSGQSLPPGTLSLTFDDGPGQTEGPGPGPRTLELGQYLAGQGIRATFFMVGKFASDLPDVMIQLEQLGHLVGNHTYDHANLPDSLTFGGDPVGQVTRTDAVIRNWIDSPVVYMRPPYGAWGPEVAATLNANLTASLSHVGPINWDIDAGDWDCWRGGATPESCAAGYLKAINTAGRGIVLMHDCTADQDVVKRANRTLELIQSLVPVLQQGGYQFARLDDVPEIVALTQAPTRIALRATNGLYMSPQGGGGGPVLVNGPAVGPWEPITVEDLYVGKVALRSTNGDYISPQGGGGADVLANGPMVGDWEPLDLISLGGNRVAFRSITGHFLDYDLATTRLTATSWLTIQAQTIFTFEYV